MRSPVHLVAHRRVISLLGAWPGVVAVHLHDDASPPPVAAGASDADSAALKDAKPDAKGASKADMTGIRKNGEEAKAEDGKKQDPLT